LRKTFGIRKSRVELGKKLLYFEMYLIKFFSSQEKRAIFFWSTFCQLYEEDV
jgi:hypothetical protein